jgi:hypothetical protein
MSKKVIGKIGYCDNKNLNGLKTLNGGHYVYIRSINKETGLCAVNTVTSLEADKECYKHNKLRHVRKGNIYSIPVYDANFTRWSGITKSPIRDVKITDIKDIGKKKIRARHKFFIGKFLNK